MKFAFILRCDGRKSYIEQTIASMDEFIDPSVTFDYGIIVNDAADPDYNAWLDETFPWLERKHHPERQGLGGCFKSALEAFMATDADMAWMVEDDTPLIGAVNLADIASVLSTQRHLSQIMLQRPAFNDAEIAAGGVYALIPEAFTENTDGAHVWTEHDRWYGFQCHLLSRDIARVMLMSSRNFLELGVTEPLKELGMRFAYWGGVNDAPLCAHTGQIRSSGYRW